MKLVMTTAVLALVWGLFGVHAARAVDTPPRPNIIFFLADDLGLDGVSAYGADKHQTPHIDALAASGIRFQTAYASPLCGPTRCLFLTGRYAFRSGGLTNQSWRPGGPGAKAVDEVPIARLLKQAGYATGHAGKWRQVGESPSDWGFDEYITDDTAGGWYWQTKFKKDGAVVNLPEGSYGPDVCRDFTFDFIRRHKDKPFFFYFATHLVHKPTLRTPDTSSGTTAIDKLYDDNIRYMDKQLGELVAELEKLGLRQNTLLIFSGDNGTAAGYPSEVHGRMINGAKGSMLEGGSRVPFIASWPAATPAGKVVEDIISFADPYVTFAELAGAKLPENLKLDGRSFAAQLRGQPGTPRDWAYVQLGAHWYIRERGFKLNERGELFDMSDAPFVEKPIAPEADTEQSKAARQRLTAALAELNPAGGKTDSDGGGGARRNRVAAATPSGKPGQGGPWKSGDSLTGAEAPAVAGKPIVITADIESKGADGVIITHGGTAHGYAVYVKNGKLAFSVREAKELKTITAKEPLGAGNFQVRAAIGKDGAMTLQVNGQQVAEGKAGGPIGQQPRAGIFIGKTGNATVGEYDAPAEFGGKISNVRVTAGESETQTTK